MPVQKSLDAYWMHHVFSKYTKITQQINCYWISIYRLQLGNIYLHVDTSLFISFRHFFSLFHVDDISNIPITISAQKSLMYSTAMTHHFYCNSSMAVNSKSGIFFFLVFFHSLVLTFNYLIEIRPEFLLSFSSCYLQTISYMWHWIDNLLLFIYYRYQVYCSHHFFFLIIIILTSCK